LLRLMRPSLGWPPQPLLNDKSQKL